MTLSALDRLIDLALDEDLGPSGDITTQSTVPAAATAVGNVKAKERLVLAGVDAFVRVFARVDPAVQVDVLVPEGSQVEPGTVVMRVRGPASSLLVGERPALNFVMRLSGVATLTHRMQAALAGTSTRVVDTRKTTPGWRALEKAAVRAGGGGNHRMGLFDGCLIKDNHITAAGGISAAVLAARSALHHFMKIEVEASTQAQVAECLACGVDAVLLDNMTDDATAQAVAAIRAHEKASGRRVVVEASGNMTLERLPRVAQTGVDLISMGALTHQATSMDLSMKIQLA